MKCNSYLIVILWSSDLLHQRLYHYTLSHPARTTMTSVRGTKWHVCYHARNFWVFSHVQKWIPGLTHKWCVLQRLSSVRWVTSRSFTRWDKVYRQFLFLVTLFLLHNQIILPLQQPQPLCSWPSASGKRFLMSLKQSLLMWMLTPHHLRPLCNWSKSDERGRFSEGNLKCWWTWD